MPIGIPHRSTRSGIQEHWPLRVGDRVMHPDFRDEAPRELARETISEEFWRPAYQDPPIVGTVLWIGPPGRGDTAHVRFPGVGVRVIGIDELTRCEL